jgi:hypothetical protein
MSSSAGAPLELPTTYPENHWTLHRERSDEWGSLDCTAAGWRLSMHVAGFSVMAEGGSRGSNANAIDELRSRLRALGWNEAPPITLRPKADRRAGRR